MRGQATQVSYKDIKWQPVLQVLPYMLQYRSRIALALACLVAAKIASIALPFALKHIVDALDANDLSIQLVALPIGLLLAYGAIRLANVLLSEVRDTLFGRVTENAMHQIGLKVFKHLHHLDLDFHLSRKTGALARDIERGTTGISFLMRFMIFNIIPTLLEIGLVLVILSTQYNLGFGLIVILSIFAYIGFSIYATEIRTQYVRQMNVADSTSNTRALDSLINYETVKYFTNEDYEATNYDKDLSSWESARRNNRLSVFALNGGQAFIISLAMTSAMILAAKHVTDGDMTLGDFVLVNAFMMQIFMPLNFLGFVYREMKGSLANIEKLFDLLAVKSKIYDAENATELACQTFNLDFNHIDFFYHHDRQILHNVSFTVADKTKVALVGASGSGKSTLAKLLFRFYDCHQGSIHISGKDIRQLTLASLREHIGVVPQDCVLFNASIEDNIRYGDLSASNFDVERAIEQAHLTEFIAGLPEGKDTRVGERGLKVSGGEKQRIAIARAILKNPPIFIFDEATSSLDSHSEKLILQAMEAISGQKTCLIIAHRLSTIANVDKIIVLDKGRIVEQGSHQQLLDAHGAYAKLWRIQQQETHA